MTVEPPSNQQDWRQRALRTGSMKVLHIAGHQFPDPKLSDRHAADRLSIPHTKLKTISQPNPSGSEIRHNTSSTLTMYMLNGAVGRVRVICQLLEAYRKHLRVLFTHERLFTPAKLRD